MLMQILKTAVFIKNTVQPCWKIVITLLAQAELQVLSVDRQHQGPCSPFLQFLSSFQTWIG